MEVFSYIISFATSKTGVDVFLAIKNIVGTGHPHYNRTDKFGSVEYWIIPKSKKNQEELIKQLKALPFIQQVSVVALSKPITKGEIPKVRELFAGIGLDASNASDEELSLLLNAKLHGKSTYLSHHEHQKHGAPEKIRVIRAEEHPHFSPEWLAKDGYEEEILDRELTIDDIEIRSVVIESIGKEPTPPPPPPPLASDKKNQKIE